MQLEIDFDTTHRGAVILTIVSISSNPIKKKEQPKLKIISADSVDRLLPIDLVRMADEFNIQMADFKCQILFVFSALELECVLPH